MQKKLALVAALVIAFAAGLALAPLTAQAQRDAEGTAKLWTCVLENIDHAHSDKSSDLLLRACAALTN